MRYFSAESVYATLLQRRRVRLEGKKECDMKGILALLLTGSLLYGFSFGDIVDNVIDHADRKAERRVEKKMDDKVDSFYDKVENSFTGTSNSGASAEAARNGAAASVSGGSGGGSSDPKAAVAAWSRYDFVPGDKVIFEDDLKGEQNGEFPSKWDLVKGVIENAELDGENVILFIMDNRDGIVPLLDNSGKDYLPEAFTIEFDAYFDAGNTRTYYVYLADMKNQRHLDPAMLADHKYVTFDRNSVGRGLDYRGKKQLSDKVAGWRHFALSFNIRALKVYLDDERLLNLPNLGYNPTGIGLSYHNPGGNSHPGYIKNIRIAAGAVPLYDKVMSEGKIVTNGIRFDVNKAVIRPESMGVINKIVSLMKQNPGLNFSIEGHTDSDGDGGANKTLSRQRADAVREKFVAMGIDAGRLQTKGWGESKPIADNTSPEGRANNRRVEFVKF